MLFGDSGEEIERRRRWAIGSTVHVPRVSDEIGPDAPRKK
jgi:hypothetical protein